MEPVIDYYGDFDEVYGYCPNCNKVVTVKTVDEGIGPYEYWGYKGWHHDYVDVCTECDGYIEGETSDDKRNVEMKYEHLIYGNEDEVDDVEE